MSNNDTLLFDGAKENRLPEFSRKQVQETRPLFAFNGTKTNSLADNGLSIQLGNTIPAKTETVQATPVIDKAKLAKMFGDMATQIQAEQATTIGNPAYTGVIVPPSGDISLSR